MKRPLSQRLLAAGQHTVNDLLNQVLNLFVGLGTGPALTKPVVVRDQRTSALVSLAPTQELKNSLRRAGYTHVHHFIVLPSCSAPRWLLPQSDPRTTLAGTQVYTPYTRAARIMKGAFLRLIRTGWNGWVGRKVLVASKEALPLEILITELTGERNPIFALSLGRQPAVRKVTVQVMRSSGEILGFMKLPLTASAVQRVRHEATVLERLSHFPALRPHIPRLLYAGPWNEGYVLFQSPLMGEDGPKGFARMHEEFLDTLRASHSVNRTGQDLIEKVASTWKTASPLLGARWEALAREVLHRSARNLSTTMLPYGLMHGDFTPWNTRIREQRLLIFDWESADWEAPVGWDRFHFHVQTGFLLNKSSGRAFTIDGNGANGSLYLLYLLNSVPQFVDEENHAAISYREELITRQVSQEAAKNE